MEGGKETKHETKTKSTTENQANKQKTQETKKKTDAWPILENITQTDCVLGQEVVREFPWTAAFWKPL